MDSAGKENIDRSSFQVRFPIGQTIGLAFLMILVLWGLTEGLLRFLVNANVINVPLIGSTNAEFDAKQSKLERFVKENGKVDCIFLGSSQFDDGANPQVFSERYQELSGKKISCFNFSIATLTASPAAEIAKILALNFHPKVIIYGTSARDYSWNFGEMARPLFEDPWVMYQGGVFSVRGWLIVNSYAVRLLAIIRRISDPEYFTFAWRTLKKIQPDGYLPLESNVLTLENKTYVEEYIQSPEDMLGLDELVKMNSNKLRIIFLEVPVHKTFMPLYVGKGEEDYRKLFLEPISKYVMDRGVIFWKSQAEMVTLIPDTGWGDVKHLNGKGSALFSRWMAERLFKVINTNEIEDPFNGF